VYLISGGLIDAGFPPQNAMRIQQEMDAALHEKRHTTRYLVQGIFDYSPRF